LESQKSQIATEQPPAAEQEDSFDQEKCILLFLPNKKM
jgi:hypothetical protein